jgi:hypothetical protein
MPRALAVLSIVGLAAGAALATASPPAVAPDCTARGFKLHGRIQVVDAFPDLKVQVVSAFPDLKVKTVQAFPDHCGEWLLVDAFPVTRVQFVTAFPDVKIKFVESFPGLP